MSRRVPWRVQSAPDGSFDEIVVGGNGGPLVLHAEAMNSRSWFIDVAGKCFWVDIDKNGHAVISGEEDRRPRGGKRVKR